MAVWRRGEAVLLSIVLSVMCTDAIGADEPLAVAVPASAESAAPAVEQNPAKDQHAAKGQGAAQEQGKTKEQPLDPTDNGGPGPSAPSSAVEGPPAVKAVLGLDDVPKRTFFVHAEIDGVPNSKGIVFASLCTRKNFTKSGCRTEQVPARKGQVSVTFAGVTPGVYAVQVHHDINANGKMDFTFFGLPEEPYGFSRDAKPILAPPKFDTACFKVSDKNVNLIINLQNT